MTCSRLDVAKGRPFLRFQLERHEREE